MTRLQLSCAALVGALVAAGAVWNHFGRPESLDEAVFLHRLREAAAAETEVIDLRKLMPGHWQQVCSAHCYDGAARVRGFDREYPAVSACQDGAWGLLFVDPAGNFVPAAGSCGAGVRLMIDTCLARDQAVLRRIAGQDAYSTYVPAGISRHGRH